MGLDIRVSCAFLHAACHAPFRLQTVHHVLLQTAAVGVAFLPDGKV